MLSLGVDQLRAGMVLAAPIPYPANPERQLLRLGYVLNQPVIEKMRELGLRRVHVAVPGLEDLDRHLAPMLSPVHQRCLTQIKLAIDTVQDRTSPTVNFDEYCAITRKLVTAILIDGRHPAYVQQISCSANDALLHAAAVAQMALMMGLQLGDYLALRRFRLPTAQARDVVGLGVAAMLHDIGVAMLPPQVRGYCDTMRPPEAHLATLYETHSALGADAIRHDADPTTVVAIQHHHRHADGSGFPQDEHLRPMKPHVFGQIILAADLFDRLANPPTGPNRNNAQALRLINSVYAGWLDRPILRCLNRIVPVFPPGSLVQLSDGTTAVVLDFDPSDPFGPMVQCVDTRRMVPVRAAFRVTADSGPQITSPTDAMDDSEMLNAAEAVFMHATFASTPTQEPQH
jgi:HD-GYP domain-containing protein (c-di-GMP phosphodiesterase class II)